MPSCDICLGENIKEKDMITCPYCGNSICKLCCQRWLIEQIITYKCNYCNKPWNLTFLYSNLPLSFLNKDLKENYAKMNMAVDNVRYFNPLKEEFNFIKNIDFVFKRIFKIVDFNKMEKIYYNANQTLTYNVSIKEYFSKWRVYYCLNKPEIINEYNKYIEQVEYIKKIYIEFNDLIDFHLFLKLFSTGNYNLYLIFILYNIFIDNSEDLLNNYNNTEYFVIQNLPIKYFTEIKRNQFKKQKAEEKLSIYSIENICNHYKNVNKYEIVKLLHELITPYKINISNQHEKLLKKKCYKCEKPNCDGIVYKYKHQSICSKCNCIFCSKCHTEIFPEKIEYSIDNKKILSMVNSKYNEYTKEQQQGKYPQKYIDLNFKLNKNNLTDEQKNDKFIKYYKYLNHVCSEDDLNNVNYFKEKVKKCPNCGMGIEKSIGCDDMWCSICKTMFKWSTLQVTQKTNNPHYFQWLRIQGIALNNNDDDQTNNEDCVEQLNFKQCIDIITRLPNTTNKEQLIRFAKLIELMPKPQNDGYMNMYRLKLAYGLIDEKQYIKYISTRYTSKFFIDYYNGIIINTIFMISEFFRQISVNNTYDIQTAKEIINIHNNAITDFNKIYHNFRINLINNNFETETKKNNKIINHKSTNKYHVELDPNITYLECPYPNFINKEQHQKMLALYILLTGNYRQLERLSYGGLRFYKQFFQIKNFKYYFPKKEIVFNQEFIDILNNDILYSVFKTYPMLDSDTMSSKVLKKIYKSNSQLTCYYVSSDSYINEYLDTLSCFILIFLKTYACSKEEILNIYSLLQSKTIYDNNTLKDKFQFNYSKDFEPYKQRAITLQKYLKFFYKNKNSELLTELYKINFNKNQLISNDIFKQTKDTYLYVLLFEKPLMEIFIRIQDKNKQEE